MCTKMYATYCKIVKMYTFDVNELSPFDVFREYTATMKQNKTKKIREQMRFYSRLGFIKLFRMRVAVNANRVQQNVRP